MEKPQSGYFINKKNCIEWIEIDVVLKAQQIPKLHTYAFVATVMCNTDLHLVGGVLFLYLTFAWLRIIDISNIDNQLDATVTAY